VIKTSHARDKMHIEGIEKGQIKTKNTLNNQRENFKDLKNNN